MHHFTYRAGVMHAEDVDLRALADEVGTPFYCYSSATLERHYRVFAEAFADRDTLVCFAMKANSNQAVLRTLGNLGAGMDIVSEGELRRGGGAGGGGARRPPPAAARPLPAGRSRGGGLRGRPGA
jgi:diaminopimelate decarboxylase